MERINSVDLMGANAYFTNFDNRIVEACINREALKKSIERTLKVLLLTKNNIVCAASHLANDVTFELLNENKILLDKQLILPAFRSDKTSITELFETRKMKQDKRDRLIGFYEEHLSKTVNWELTTNSNWFKEKFILGLQTENPVIRNRLYRLNDKQINNIINGIKDREIFSRDSVDELSQGFDIESRRVLKNYRELVYHMSGARVCNCESTLPQENYIDYSLADIQNKRTMLSESQIFYKLYMELLYESMSNPCVPTNILDMLSFEDIYEIRMPIQNSQFVKDYDALIRQSIELIKKENKNDYLYSVKDLLRIRDHLEKNFKEKINKEIKCYLKKKSDSSSKELMKSACSVSMAFVNFLPWTISSFFMDCKSLIFNCIDVLNSVKCINNVQYYSKIKNEHLVDLASKWNIETKTEFIDVMNLMNSYCAKKSEL